MRLGKRVTKLNSHRQRKAEFIELMDCARSKLPDGPGWIYEIKLDGYRAIAVKADGRVNLFSRRRKSFDHHYPLIVEALAELLEGTVVDGEIVALDAKVGTRFANAALSGAVRRRKTAQTAEGPKQRSTKTVGKFWTRGTTTGQTSTPPRKDGRDR